MFRKSFFSFFFFFSLSIFHYLEEIYSNPGFIQENYKNQVLYNLLPKLNHLTINHLGELYLTPDYEEIFTISDGLAIWNIYQNVDHIYLGTANPARIFKINPSKKTNTLIYKFDDSLATVSILQNPKTQDFYIANSSKSAIIILDKNLKKILKKIDFNEKYIWKMIFDAQRQKLFIVTGLTASLYEIDIQNYSKKKLFTLSNEDHILSIAQHKNKLYLGTAISSTLYEYDLENNLLKALFSDQSGEIKDILIHPNNEKIFFIISNPIYEIGLKKNGSIKSNNPNNSNNQMNANKNKKTSRKPYHPKMIPNRLMQINSEGKFTEILSKFEHRFHSLALNLNDNQLYLGTGNHGMLFKLNLNSIDMHNLKTPIHIFLNLPESQIHSMHFDPQNSILYTALGNIAKLYKTNLKNPKIGTYISKVIHLDKKVKWGKVIIPNLYQQKNINQFLQAEIRIGNTKKVNKSWSKWTKINFNTENINLSSQSIQYKLTLYKNFPIMQGIESLKITYFSAYSSPNIESITIEKISNHSFNSSAENDLGENDIRNTFANFIPNKVNSDNLSLKWSVISNLVENYHYSILYRKRNAIYWDLLAHSIHETFYNLDASKFPDQEYQFKIIMVNKYFKDDRVFKISPFFLFDSTPPQFNHLKVTETQDSLFIHGNIEDFSPIHSVFFSLNSQDWVYAEASDKIYDSNKENFSFTISKDNLFENQDNFIILKGFDCNNNFVLKTINIPKVKK